MWKMDFQVIHTSGKSMSLDWSRVRIFDNEVARMFLAMIKTNDKAM
jgi:hypothetical protein